MPSKGLHKRISLITISLSFLLMFIILPLLSNSVNAYSTTFSSTFTTDEHSNWWNSWTWADGVMKIDSYEDNPAHPLTMNNGSYNITFDMKTYSMSEYTWLFSWSNKTLPAMSHVGLSPVLVYDSTFHCFLRYDEIYTQYELLMSNVTSDKWYHISIKVNMDHTLWDLYVNTVLVAVNIPCCDFTSGGYTPDLLVINDGPFRNYNNLYFDNITVDTILPDDVPVIEYSTTNWIPILLGLIILWLPAMLLGWLAPVYGTVIGVSLMGVVSTIMNPSFVIVLIIILAVSTIILWRSAR